MEGRLTSTREHVVRLEELVQSHKRLLSQDLVKFSDEVASARRRFQSLTGPSGISDTKERLRLGKDVCWRLRSSDKEQGEMSLKILRDGLYKANKLFFNLRLEARDRLPYGQYWTMMEELGERSKHIRTKEKVKLHKKETYLKRRDSDCNRHILCRWMRKFADGKSRKSWR